MRVGFLFFTLLFYQSIAFSVPPKGWINLKAKSLVARCGREDDSHDGTPTRRSILVGLGAMLAIPLPSLAGEVGARITQAVTTSDLGISVRTSVVKGAQVIDQADGAWERFSDKFGLGSERSKQVGRPKPKVIPDPLPLDVQTAKRLMEISDQAFCTCTGIRPSTLQERTEKVANLVKIPFERSGVETNSINPLQLENGSQYNFVVYSHFKAYSDLVLEQKIPFGSFRSKFEQQMGQQLVELLQPGYTKASSSSRKGSLQSALKSVDDFCNTLREKGMVALVERNPLDDDEIEDWEDGISDLELSVALDGDITLDAQILLQEQGFRLYPNFARYAISYLLQQIPDQKVSSMDYYFDTGYSSDPDKFEVKEVILNVQLENL